MQEEVVEREDYKNKKNGIIKNGHDYQYYILPLLTLLPKKYNLKLLEFKIVFFFGSNVLPLQDPGITPSRGLR